MPTPQNKSETASVDWAEKLKASMNAEPTDSESKENNRVEDDLAALLRAQLHKSTEDAPPADVPDTSEFEWEEAEENIEFRENLNEDISISKNEFATAWNENILEDEFDEALDEDIPEDEFDEDLDEDIPEDEFDEALDEDIPEDEFDEDLDEDIPEDEFDEDLDEDIPEDEFDEDLDEDIPEDEFDEDLDEDIPEDEFDEDLDEDIPEDEFDEDLDEDIPEDEFDEDLDEDIPEDEFDEDLDEGIPEDEFDEDLDELLSPPIPSPPPPPPTTVYRRPTSHTLSDDHLNSASVPTEIGGQRLLELAGENQRLITESQIPADDVPSQTHISDIPPISGEISVPAQTRLTDAQRPRSVSRVFSPLQLGLDDISPTAKKSSPPPSSQQPPPAPADSSNDPPANDGDYTDRMTADNPTDPEDSGLGDTDLYLRLGYEDALRHTADQLKMEQLRESDTQKTAENDQAIRRAGEPLSVRVDREYRGREDTANVERAYNRARQRNVARLVIASMGAVIGLLYELLPVLLAPVSRLTTVDTPYYLPLGLVWTLVICLPFLPRLGRGLKSLLDFEPTRYAVSSMALIVSLIHGTIAWAVGNPYSLPLFGSSALFILAVAALSEFLVTEGEYRAFLVASSGKPPYLLTDESTPASAALNALHAREEIHTRRRIFTVVRAGCVSDYFARTGRYNPYMGRLNYLLPAALLSAILCAGLRLALGDGLTDALRTFTATYLFCLPSAYLIAMTLPLNRVNRTLGQKGTAVIGAAAPADYISTPPAHLIFSDGDALKALHRKDITLRGDTRSAECRRMADTVFRLLNTPLAVEPPLREGQSAQERIEIAEIDEQYMRLYLVNTRENSTTEIMMGSHSALTRRGIRLPKLNMEQRYKKSEGSHVLYMAFNRSFHLAYAMEYRVGRTFSHVITNLYEQGYEASIASFDPLVDPAMEGLVRLRKRRRLDVLRPEGFEAFRKSRESGLIATGRSLDILHPLRACHAMLRAYRRSHLFQWLCLIPGITLSVLAVCMGWTWLSLSGAIVLWHLLQGGLTLWIALAATDNKTLEQASRTDPAGSDPKPEREEPTSNSTATPINQIRKQR